MSNSNDHRKRHLNVLLELLGNVFFFLSSIWMVTINVNCLEASKLDFTSLNLHHTLAQLSWSNFGACCFVQDLRSWRAKKKKSWREQGQQSRIVNMALKIYKWSHVESCVALLCVSFKAKVWETGKNKVHILNIACRKLFRRCALLFKSSTKLTFQQKVFLDFK